MRSGGFDTQVRFVRPGSPVRVGRSRVDGADAVLADKVPARIEAGAGTERLANATNAATAPIIIIVRREPDLDDVTPDDAVIDLATSKRYDIKSVRQVNGDRAGGRRSGGGRARDELEILAVTDAS